MPDQLEVSIRATRAQVDDVLIPLAKSHGLPAAVLSFRLNKPLDISTDYALGEGKSVPVHLVVEELADGGSAPSISFPGH